MIVSNDLLGQWVKHFSYGPEYGEELFGQKVKFRLFINSCSNNEFDGKCIDLKGVGANFEVGDVKGFIENKFISFTKQYPKFYQIDEFGHTVTNEEKPHPSIMKDNSINSQVYFQENGN